MQVWLVLGNYIGCFVDSGADRTLPYEKIESADLTPVICVQHCINAGGYEYAGKRSMTEPVILCTITK